MDWSKQKYNEYSEYYMPWFEDKYLQWFGDDNKASYAAKDQLKQAKTGDKNVDAIQDGVAEGVGGQLGKGGLLKPVGDLASKEGVNRAERGGKDEKGSVL
ncbi:MAG: hypothetical protein M1831_007271 [Alyxoria varia]|nr:MAG: hypothetical protein M1831_007271 [Alyxoria varia]